MYEYERCDRCDEVLVGPFYIESIGWDEEFSAPIAEFVCRECATNEE